MEIEIEEKWLMETKKLKPLARDWNYEEAKEQALFRGWLPLPPK